MIHSKVIQSTKKLKTTTSSNLFSLTFTMYKLQCLQYSSTYKYLVKYLSISTSTLGKLRKYLSKVQVLSNLYLSISTHVLGPMSAWPMLSLLLGTRTWCATLGPYWLQHVAVNHTCGQLYRINNKLYSSYVYSTLL